jgi:hypothetical protein
MGRLGEVLGSKYALNKTSHGLRTVQENHFGPVNCKIMFVWIIKVEETPESVLSCSHVSLQSNMELVPLQNHPALDVF